MKIYIVLGGSGEYSDSDQWIVKAFTDESKAREFVNECTAHANIIKQKLIDDEVYTHPEGIHPLDPQFNNSYTGANYWIEETELSGGEA